MNSQRGFANILMILILLAGLVATVYLIGRQTNILSQAAETGKWINGVSTAGFCNVGLQCDLGNALVKDGKNAGLYYPSAGGGACNVNNINVSSCETVNLGATYDLSQIKVDYQMVNSICGDSCEGQYCGTNPGGAVFSSLDQQSWTSVGSLGYSTSPTTQTFNTAGKAQYVMVCRGGGGGGRDNIALDNVSALPLTNNLTPTPPVPPGEKDALLTVCNGLAVAAQPYCRQFVEKDYGFNNGRGYIDDYLSYAWGESYILPAYARMYKATRSTLYLDKLVRHIDVVLANRDDKVGRKDYKGVSAAGWVGNEKYSAPGKPMRFVVHSGVIISGMVDFIRIVNADEKLWPAYKQKADEYLGAVREVVAAHDAEWKTAGSTGIFTSGISTTSFCNTGFQCDLGNALAKDGKNTGLFLPSSGTKVCKINNFNATSCATVDLGATYDISQVKVDYQMIDNICGDSCDGTACGTNPGGAVFLSPDQQSWTSVGSLKYSTSSTTQTFNTTGKAKYIMVCRGGGGGGRSNIALDNVSVKQSAAAGGFYYYAADAPVPVGSGFPVQVNMGAAMGIDLFYLYDLTHDQSYLDKATKIAQLLKSKISPAGTGYTWKYWSEIKADLEDISHGNIDVNLARTAFEHGVVFNATDMGRFAETFTKKVYTGSSTSISIHVDGTDPSAELTWRLAPGRGWIDLNPYSNNQILPLVKKYYDSIDFSKVYFPSAATGLAALTDLLSGTK